MSEFKYACPVCGQHIKCDSSQTGTVMDCPTCFQKITVPQAPTSADQKLIITGSKVGGKRTSASSAAANSRTLEPAKGIAAAVALVLALVLAAGAGVYFFGGRIISAHASWKTADIGAVGPAGTFSETAESLSIAGSGADIWAQTDAFHYVSREVSGDVSLTAHVVGIQNTDPWAKAGLMVRESVAPNSANVMICVTANNGVAFQQRAASGGTATSVLIVPHLRAPYWVRLIRRGNVFTAESSADGNDWKPAGSTTVAMKKDVSAGLAVCSHNAATLCRASFDQVAVNGASVRNMPAGSNATVPAPSGSPPRLVAPLANDTNWMLVLDTNAIPEAPAAGRIHGQDFILEHASFQNGSLQLRWGSRGSGELAVSLNFSGAQAEELTGKTLNVTTNAEKAAMVTLRWKDDSGTTQRSSFEAGYALRLQFGTLANNRLPGKIYLCLPDAEKSYVFGSFTASVSKPKPKAEQKLPPK